MSASGRLLFFAILVLVVLAAVLTLFDQGAAPSDVAVEDVRSGATETPGAASRPPPEAVTGSADAGEKGVPTREAAGEQAASFAAEDELVVRGRVLDARTGAPLADAEVTLLYPDGGTVASTDSDAEGRYRLEVAGAVPSHLALRGWAEGHASLSVAGLGRPAGGGDLVRDLRLQPWFRIEGRVVSTVDGSPVVGADVEIRSRDPTFEDAWDDAETDATGRYVIDEIEDLPRSGVDVFVDAVDHAPQVRLDLSVPDGADVLRVDFELWPQLTVRGRVVSSVTGQPIEDAEIALGSHDPEYVDETEEDLTDEDGSFEVEIDTLPYEGLYLLLSATDHCAVLLDPLPTPDRRGLIDVGEVRLPPPLRIRGVVVDARTGRPVSGGDVSAYASRLGSGDDVEYSDGDVIGVDGRFDLELEYAPREGLTVLVEPDDHVPQERRVEVPPNVPVYEMKFVVEPVLRFEGVVRRKADGTPVAGALVRVLLPGRGTAAPPTARCRADGSFSMELPARLATRFGVVVEFIDRRFALGEIEPPVGAQRTVRREFVVDLPPLRRRR